MTTSRWRQARVSGVRVSNLLVDAAVAGLVLVLSVLAPRVDHGRVGDVASVQPPTLGDAPLALGVLACVVLVVRRVHPVATLVVALLASCAATLLGDVRAAFFLPVVVAVFTVALAGPRRTSLVTGVLAAVASTAASMVAAGRFELDVLGLVAWSLFAAAAGDGVRSRRAYVRAVEERAEKAEQTREEEARRRLAEERLGIARELHDVIAHHVTVINVQAQLGRHLLAVGQPGAEDALGHIATASRTLLEEFRGMLGVLRAEEGEPVTTAPAPTIAELDLLVENFLRTGLRVQFSQKGRPRPVPPGVDLVTYRVVQEALTNAQRYGTGDAHLTLEYQRDALVVRVDNPVDPEKAAPELPSGTGHGLVGIRERAVAVGGTSRPGFLDPSTYRLEAVLPLGDHA